MTKLYEVHQRGVNDADTGKPSWYQMAGPSPERAAEAYVEQHAKCDCSVLVRNWPDHDVVHGWFDVEYPLARAERAENSRLQEAFGE